MVFNEQKRDTNWITVYVYTSKHVSHYHRLQAQKSTIADYSLFFISNYARQELCLEQDVWLRSLNCLCEERLQGAGVVAGDDAGEFELLSQMHVCQWWNYSRVGKWKAAIN